MNDDGPPIDADRDGDGGRVHAGWFSFGAIATAAAIVGLIGFGISLDNIVGGVVKGLFPSAEVAADEDRSQQDALRSELAAANNEASTLRGALETASERIEDLFSQVERNAQVAQAAQAPSEDATGIAVAGGQALSLTTMEPVVNDGTWSVEPASVGGRDFADSIVVSTAWGDGRPWAEYALNGEWTELSGSVGIVDAGHSSEKAQVKIMVDGSERKSIDLAVGRQAQQFRVDLSGAQRLRIQFIDMSNSAFRADGVLAEPQLTS